MYAMNFVATNKADALKKLNAAKNGVPQGVVDDVTRRINAHADSQITVAVTGSNATDASVSVS